MSYKLSRKDFLKGVGAGAITIAAAGTLVGCKSNSGTGKGIYTPGTYTATAKGIGTVKMTATLQISNWMLVRKQKALDRKLLMKL